MNYFFKGKFGQLFIVCLSLLFTKNALGDPVYLKLPGGDFESALKGIDGKVANIKIAPFMMRSEPVTRLEWARFLEQNPYWSKAQVPHLLASSSYLKSWPEKNPPVNNNDFPITEISWYAARAYCAAEGARLPTWHEWEYAAAADDKNCDARKNKNRNQDLLTIVLARTGEPMGAVGRDAANCYGLHDFYGLIDEWVDDYASMFPNPDSRDPGQGSSLAFCGGAALAFQDREQYALMSRVTTLSAFKPLDSSSYVGFRCAKSLVE